MILRYFWELVAKKANTASQRCEFYYSVRYIQRTAHQAVELTSDSYSLKPSPRLHLDDLRVLRPLLDFVGHL